VLTVEHTPAVNAIHPAKALVCVGRVLYGVPLLRRHDVVGPEALVTTTFATHYGAEISLREMLDPEMVERYTKTGTGEKFLVKMAG
jgi:hypothetical protein